MNIKFAHRMKDYEAGIFQVLNEKKDEAERQGRTIYNLSVGTPDFPPAAHVVEAVVKASAKPENYKYALIDIPELIEAVQTRYKKRYGVTLQKDEIMSVYGSQEGIAHICLSLCDPGDVVLVPNPGYPIFGIGPSLAGAEVVTYDLKEEDHYLPDLDGMAEEVLARAKCMIVSYPLNPVCKAAPDEFYEKLIPWAAAHEILIIHDNAYSDIIYDGREGKSILRIPGAKETAVEFYSLSKSFNYTGARVSFLTGNKDVVACFKRLRSQIDYGTYLPVQYGAVAALNGSDQMVKDQCAEYQRRRDTLCGGLRKIGWPMEDSEGTMFAWAKIPAGYTDDVAFVMELVEKSGVLCTPGSSFGTLGKGHVRFALTMPVEKIKEAVEAIAASGMIRG
ncbi:MAG: aminotransferase class I/II-fold pyridoxal phosphate-dependent enzyme [Lachnospiraceae bacterium]|jgi:LL-diaminopimelate aminotransferase|nr:aminotransferase class I/II-fold pyridoxal phosphate-dependent enzyme [Lachnospiraceae bacterium]MCI9014200.1 aminotransferase class I/II-fold pyridoxal phosphate-dependent enzyme [Lachnospiraceae bacterium]MCI9253743.1 aminotransferase class I/II-fold pyridoxal phosphate-dependent enzyme [Lachnospiraceae bacterium]